MLFWRMMPAQAGQPVTAKRLAAGWNGMRWGFPLSAFRVLHPRASHSDSGWWTTGAEPEQFCGITMAYTQYAFNGRGELYLVSFIPEQVDRERLTPAVIDAIGPPSTDATVWQLHGTTLEIKTAGVLATMTSQRYASR